MNTSITSSFQFIEASICVCLWLYVYIFEIVTGTVTRSRCLPISFQSLFAVSKLLLLFDCSTNPVHFWLFAQKSLCFKWCFTIEDMVNNYDYASCQWWLRSCPVFGTAVLIVVLIFRAMVWDFSILLLFKKQEYIFNELKFQNMRAFIWH